MKIILKPTDNGVLLYPSIGKLSDISGLVETLGKNNISYNDKFISIPLEDNGHIEPIVTKIYRIFEEHVNIELFTNNITFEQLLKNKKVLDINGNEVNLYSITSTAIGTLGSLSPTDNLHYLYSIDNKVYLSSKVFKDNHAIFFESIKDYQCLIFENNTIDECPGCFSSIKSFISSKRTNGHNDKVVLSLISNA